MQPIGPLMIEHRLIERVVAHIGSEAERLEQGGAVDPAFISTVVDFMRVYADKTHHGKEEDILFEDLRTRDLSDEDARLLEELNTEHVKARAVVTQLSAAGVSAADGDATAKTMAISALKEIATLYPQHIEKEDARFFPASMTYLGQDERDAMLEEFNAFDRQMIHTRYKEVVERLSDEHGGPPESSDGTDPSPEGLAGVTPHDPMHGKEERR